MEIELKKRANKKVRLEDIESGYVFRYYNRYYIKCNAWIEEDEKRISVLHIATSNIFSFEPNILVIPIESRLIIEDFEEIDENEEI